MVLTTLNLRVLTVLVAFSICTLIGASSGVGAQGPIDLNQATMEQLQTLPGIGPELAQRILAYRTESGSFKSVEDLMNVKGIGERKLSKLRDRVTVGSPKESGGSSPAK